MDLLLTIIAFIIVFSIVVLIHEFGHFIVARRNGVKVEEFGFGLPPKIWGFHYNGVLYSINALPFGGFCRLLGEDSKDGKTLRDPESFVSKSLGAKARIVVAGVLMNFLLAIALLSIGFSIGIKPLIVSEQDVFSNIVSGVIDINEGFVIKSVAKGSSADNLGFKEGDVLMQMNNKDITDFNALKSALSSMPSNWPLFKVRRGDSVMMMELRGRIGTDSGIGLYDMFFLPRVVVKSVIKDSEMDKAGIKAGDAILNINGEQVFDANGFQEILDESQSINIAVLRDYKKYNFNFNVPFHKNVIVSDTILGGIAEKAGFMKGDYMLQINGVNVLSPRLAVSAVKSSVGKRINVLVERNGLKVSMFVTPNLQGQIGIVLSKVIAENNNQLVAYTSSIPTSVLGIGNVSYPPHIAVWKAVTESKRLGVFTAQMLGKLVKDIVGTLKVPEGISGPVGIAHMTYIFVKEGFSSVIRFVALLSLSLAVLNILPFPGLDGGRLLFIFVEWVTGRRVNQKFESLTHMIGFVLLLLLVLFVTYKDVASLF